MISDRDIAEIKTRTDLVDLVGERVTLRRKGRLWWGRCPFHDEKTPSFKVEPDVGLYHCFGCGESGDCFSFVMKLDGLEFLDAVRMLADRAHYQLEETPTKTGVKRARLMDAHRAAQRHYAKELMQASGAEEARRYLASRGFHSEMARRFDVGWAPGGRNLVEALGKEGFGSDELVAAGLAVRGDGGRLADRFRKRIVFPIADAAGRVIAFGGRVVDDSLPKYLNSADSSVFSKGRVLYALDKAKKSITASRTAIVVEGYTDVMAAHAAGVENVVATLGTAFTEEHLRLLGRFADSVILVFDADAAGLAAAERGLRFVSEYGLPSAGVVASVVDAGKVDVRVAVLPEGRDPADMLAEGPEVFEETLAAAEPVVDFAIARRLARHDLKDLSGRLEAAREALDIVQAMQSAPARTEYVRRIATQLHLQTEDLERELARGARARQTSSPTGGTSKKRATSDDRVSGGTVAYEGEAEARTPERLAEEEALAALLHRPALMAHYGDFLGSELFSWGSTRRVWEALKGAGPDAKAQEVVSALASERAAIAALASSLLAQTDVVGLADNFADILVRLKDFAIGRQIDDVSARMGRAERGGEPTDDIARELWELQRERHMWRHEPPLGPISGTEGE